MSKAGFQTKVTDEESILDVIKHYRRALIVFAIFITTVMAANSYAVSIFTVDGVSMHPTLKDDSRKLLYKLPATVAKLNHSSLVPKRGTIVVVEKDEDNLFDPEAAQEKSYVVKRVVALPSERVVISGGVITVFNKENERGFVPDEVFDWIDDRQGSEEFRMDITLKEGEVFVVGDNRDESIDSRIYGPISSTQIVGTVIR